MVEGLHKVDLQKAQGGEQCGTLGELQVVLQVGGQDEVEVQGCRGRQGLVR